VSCGTSETADFAQIFCHQNLAGQSRFREGAGAFLLLALQSLRYRPRMPRDGALTLSDVHGAALAIVCQPCASRGRYAVAKLFEEHGDAKLTDYWRR
jgi:hypothetical protein